MKIFVFVVSFVFVNNTFAAPFNLNDDLPLSYAIESLEDRTVNAIQITSPSDTLNIEFKPGFAISNASFFIRFDLHNAKFAINLPSSGLMASGAYSSLLAVGGVEGDNFAIIEISAPTPIAQDSSLVLPSTSFDWLDIAQPTRITYRLYDSAADAVNERANLYEITTEFSEFKSSLGDKFSQSFIHKVGIEQDFLRFIPTFRSPGTFSLGDANDTLASMAKVIFSRLITEEVRLPSTSEVITDFKVLLPNIDTSLKEAFIAGDFSAGKVFLSANDDCSVEGLQLAKDDNDRMQAVSIDELIVNPVLCFEATSNNVAVPRTAFSIDLGIGIESNIFGEIKYNAATINLPYLTRFSSYRQRVYLVNHAGYDVRYVTRFTAEEAVKNNFVLKDKHTGFIPASTTLMLDVRDMVDIIAGVPTRLSATIFVDAKASDISAATQIISLEDTSGAPITNVLEVEKR